MNNTGHYDCYNPNKTTSSTESLGDGAVDLIYAFHLAHKRIEITRRAFNVTLKLHFNVRKDNNNYYYLRPSI